MTWWAMRERLTRWTMRVEGNMMDHEGGGWHGGP